MTLHESGRNGRLDPSGSNPESGSAGLGLIGRPALRGRGAALVISACLPLAAACLVVALSGCNSGQDAGADATELRLTRNAEWNGRPFFSPDGARVAFSCRLGHSDEKYVLCTIPAKGGEARRVTPDTCSYVGVRWTRDGGFFAMDNRTERVVRLGSDGAVLQELPETPLAWLFDVSPDEKSYLFGKFNGDNYDPALFDPATEKLDFITETPKWEVNGCFGPGPREVTLVVAEGPSAETTQISIVNIDTGDSQLLALPAAKLDGPVWSPNGRYLLFSCNQAKSQDIWVYDRETSTPAPVTSGPEEDVSPAWSPDGTAITFARRTSQENVFVVNPVTAEEKQLTSGPARDTSPLISPDGSLVAYVHVPTTSDQQKGMVPDMYVVPSAGGEPRALGLHGLKSKSERSFCWSPDGTELALALDDGNGDTEIYRVSVNGGEPVPVTLSSGVEHFPAWSPSGDWVAYTSFDGGQTRVCMVPATGGLVVQISRHDGVNRLPVWSWDSRYVAYHTIEEEGGSSVWVSPADHPESERLICRAGDWTVPFAWTRSGKELLVFRVKGGEWSVHTLPLDGSEGILVGTPSSADGRMQYVLSFTPEGERYREDVYPEHLVACSDGERISEIYVLRVADVLGTPLTANRR